MSTTWTREASHSGKEPEPCRSRKSKPPTCTPLHSRTIEKSNNKQYDLWSASAVGPTVMTMFSSIAQRRLQHELAVKCFAGLCMKVWFGEVAKLHYAERGWRQNGRRVARARDVLALEQFDSLLNDSFEFSGLRRKTGGETAVDAALQWEWLISSRAVRAGVYNLKTSLLVAILWTCMVQILDIHAHSCYPCPINNFENIVRHVCRRIAKQKLNLDMLHA